MESLPPVIPGEPTGCPAWCLGDHEGEPRHLAELHCMYPEPVKGERLAPILFTGLRQGPDDGLAVVHVDLDEMPLLQLLAADAARLGWVLVELALMAGAE